jgi:hypothetical protein
MTDDAPIDPKVPPPDVRGRRLDHPASAPLKAELIALTETRPLELLVPENDLEAGNFAAMIREFMHMNGREITTVLVRLDPPFRGLQLHEGDDKVQLTIGHR